MIRLRLKYKQYRLNETNNTNLSVIIKNFALLTIVYYSMVFFSDSLNTCIERCVTIVCFFFERSLIVQVNFFGLLSNLQYRFKCFGLRHTSARTRPPFDALLPREIAFSFYFFNILTFYPRRTDRAHHLVHSTRWIKEV